MYNVITTEQYAQQPASRVPRKAVWGGFKENTTAHGVPHISRSRGPIKTAFWILVLLGCLGGLIYNFYVLTDKFFGFGVNVKIEVKHQSELTFPAVTVCNHNPVRKTALRETPDLNDIVYPSGPAAGPEAGPEAAPGPARKRRKRAAPPTSAPDVTTDGPVGPAAGPGPGVTEDPMGPAEDTGYGYGDEAGFPQGDRRRDDGRQQREAFEKMLKVQRVLADLGTEEKKSLGHAMGEFIVDCSYGGYECYINGSSFSSFYNEMYGNCFTFNSGWDGQDLEVSFKAGPQYGLQLIFNIDQDEYVGDLAEAAGVRVVIHPQERMPFPEDEGLSISPAMMTNVGVKMLQITRKGGRYGNCTSTDDSSQKTSWRRNVFSEYYPVSYTASACYKTCYQKDVISRCQCFDSQYPGYGLAFDNVNVTSCDPANDTAVDCMDEVTEDYRTGSLSCSCPLPCSESTYSQETTAVLWPSSDYKETLFEALASSDEKIRRVLNNEENPEKYKENLVKLVVYYQEFNYETIYEVAAYESGQFVSDIGGILGLFIGFSIMTIVEFFELGFDLIFVSMASAFSRSSGARRLQPTGDGSDVTGSRTGSTFTVHGAPTPPPPYYTDPPVKLGEMTGSTTT